MRSERTAIGPHGIFADGGDVSLTNGGPTGPTREGEIVLRDPTRVAEEPVSALYGKLFALRVGGRDELYVSNHSREAGAGEVLRIDLG